MTQLIREQTRRTMPQQEFEPAVAEVKTRVLVVDDDDAVRCSLRLALESHGYEVNEACDGVEGVLLQERTLHDIAIIDMMMPNKDGIETVLELKAKFPDLCILAISGASAFAKMDYLKAAMQLGATATLRKPFAGGDLLDVLNEIASVTDAGA